MHARNELKQASNVLIHANMLNHANNVLIDASNMLETCLKNSSKMLNHVSNMLFMVSHAKL